MIQQLPLNDYPSLKTLLPKIERFADTWMSRNDSSHDHLHVRRVAQRALAIAKKEVELTPQLHYNLDLVYAAALLHDVTDRKYAKGGRPSLVKDPAVKPMCLKQLLRDHVGCDDEKLLEDLDQIVRNVSYSTEKANPQQTAIAIARYPELALVQDADRIESVGAIGIARMFAFGNVVETEQGIGQTLETMREHFDDKLFHLDALAKTQVGKKMLEDGIRKLHTFKEWFDTEMKSDVIFP